MKSKPSKAQKQILKTLTQLETEVLEVLNAESNKPLNYKQIAARLGILDGAGRALVETAVSNLITAEKIKEQGRGKYQTKLHDTVYTGTVDMTSSGAAYVIVPELEDDIYIPSRQVKNALDGDTVSIRITAGKRSGKTFGTVVKVLERKRLEFVGTLEVTRDFAFLVPDYRKMSVDIFIGRDHLNGAKNGQKVVVRITDYPEKASSPIGEVIQVLGAPGNHEVEIHAILAEYGLPAAFPEEVLAAAEKIPRTITEKDLAQRRDMRPFTTFTIDPFDAKDFDDALSLHKLENGHWEVGVHIADVTHYLEPGGIIDKEAYNRATSVYLVDRVVPMLPEVLSNDLCSLRPNEDKLTFSAIFEMDGKGQVFHTWIGRTVIHSDHRFTYEGAQEILEGADGPFKKELLVLNQIAKALRKDRFKNGAFSFDKKELKFHLDEAGKPTGVYQKVAKDANHLIEEFMLMANKKVAEFGSQPEGRTFVYRVHDDPDPEKIRELAQFVSQLGYKINPTGRKVLSQSMNKMLLDVKDKPESNMLETLVIRSMAKAKYDVKNVGHYGLAFGHYTHFTSPIRRYPDVMVHRLLQHYLDGKQTPPAKNFEEDCKHSSAREKMAADAERASIKYMQVKFMEDHLNQEFDGVITGVTEWGVYVEISENHCEGMIKIRDFRDDYYVFEEKKFRIIGERRRKIYQLGDPVRIRVKSVDFEKKQIDFVMANKK
jgi:ribonuclease R